MPRQSRDLAKRLRFDRYPRRDTFRRFYGPAALVGLLIAVAIVLGLWRYAGNRQYLPGPVSPSHARFGDRCEACHDAFRTVQDKACLKCHGQRQHSAFEVRTPECRQCHVEHRAQPISVVSATLCVDCHAALKTTEPVAHVETTIGSFAAHPEFVPLRKPFTDATNLRFNHQVHLTSTKVIEPPDSATPGAKLSCPACHHMEPAGRYMVPISFKNNCQRCHIQKVTEAPYPLGDIEAPHDQPLVVREGVTRALLALATFRTEDIFQSPDIPLPGRVTRRPVDESATLRAFQAKWLEEIEAKLYGQFDPTKPFIEHNKYCFLCHIQDGTRERGMLAAIKTTAIPARWLRRGEFSHRRHGMLKCVDCHASIQASTKTEETNLPKRELCQRCHVDAIAQSVGTACPLCHLYHDTSKDPVLRQQRRKEVDLSILSGAPAASDLQAATEASDVPKR